MKTGIRCTVRLDLARNLALVLCGSLGSQGEGTGQIAPFQMPLRGGLRTPW